VFELLQGLLTRQEVLRPLEPHLSLYYTKNELGTIYEAKPSFLHTIYREGYGGHLSEARRISTSSWGGLEHLDGQPVVHVADRLIFSAFTNFKHHQPTPLTSFDTCMKQFLIICQSPGRSAPLWLSWAWALCHIIPSCGIVYDYVLFWT
jgi:hypothetical protein